MIATGLIFNFIGDSITAGASASTSEKIYYEVLKKELGLKAVNGYGICGTRIARQNKPSDNPEFDRYFASRIDDMDENADVIVVFGGTNDYGHGDAELGNENDRTPETFYGACHDLFCRLINKYPGKKIIVMTPLHRLDEDNLRGEGKKEKDGGTLREYVSIIRNVAEYYSLPVLDLYRISGMQPNVPCLREKFNPDGLHPNDAGHKIIADMLANFIKTL